MGRRQGWNEGRVVGCLEAGEVLGARTFLPLSGRREDKVAVRFLSQEAACVRRVGARRDGRNEEMHHWHRCRDSAGKGLGTSISTPGKPSLLRTDMFAILFER